MDPLIGFISDAHGNDVAFDRGVALLLSQGAQRLYFLGDAIGYVPSAKVLDSLARLGDRVQCVRGNHEAMLESGCDASREHVYKLKALRSSLTSRQRRMISSWPALREVVIEGMKLLLVHGSPTDPTYGYVYPDTVLDGFSTDADWVFMGHTHHPFVREHLGTCYVNIGSCGMPRDDGRYGAVAILDTKARKARILRYDITTESKRVLKLFPMIDPSVREVYARRHSHLTGEIV